MNPLKIPQFTSYVNDFSGVLSPAERDSFAKQLEEHEAKTSEQVVVVFIPHREGNELLDIGLKLFNENGIGQKNLNNGLLLIITTEEKKIRIITGKGMEIKYSEMDCQDIIENHLRPLLNDGEYKELIGTFINITTGIKNYNNDDSGISKQQGKEKDKKVQEMEPYHIVILIWIIISMLKGIQSILLFFPIYILSFSICRILIDKFRFSLNKGMLIGFSVSIILIHGSLNMYCSYYTAQCSTINKTFQSITKHGNGSSHSSSSHSSFGGGGGSSNGGGYGD